MIELLIGFVIGVVATLVYSAWANGRFKDGVQVDDFKPR